MIIEVGVGATEDAAAHGDSQYVLGNLEHAVYRLTVGEGDVRRRLLDAHSILHPVTEADFPPHLVDDWRWIEREWTKFGPQYAPDGTVWRGSVEHTLGRIINRTGAKIAVRIVTLRNNLRTYVTGQNAV